MGKTIYLGDIFRLAKRLACHYGEFVPNPHKDKEYEVYFPDMEVAYCAPCFGNRYEYVFIAQGSTKKATKIVYETSDREYYLSQEAGYTYDFDWLPTLKKYATAARMYAAQGKQSKRQAEKFQDMVVTIIDYYKKRDPYYSTTQQIGDYTLSYWKVVRGDEILCAVNADKLYEVYQPGPWEQELAQLANRIATENYQKRVDDFHNTFGADVDRVVGKRRGLFGR